VPDVCPALGGEGFVKIVCVTDVARCEFGVERRIGVYVVTVVGVVIVMIVWVSSG
jgi:hypothetical protein